MKVEPGSSATTSLKLSTIQGKKTTVSWSADAPAGITLSPSHGTVTVPGNGAAAAELAVRVAADTKSGVYRVPFTLTGQQGAKAPTVWLSVTVGVNGSVTWYVNSNGISYDDANPTANFDGGGWSYSAKALAAAGAAPGGTVSADGFDFTWPDVAPGAPDNIVVGGGDQVLDVSKTSAKRHEAEPARQRRLRRHHRHRHAHLHRRDHPAGRDRLQRLDARRRRGHPSFGNTIAVHTAYRDVMGGSTDPVGTDVFATAPIALQSGKQLASVTLLTTTQGGDMHVFGIATA